MNKETTKEEFLTMLKKHDWNFRMADDIRAYNVGKAKEMNILNAINKNPEFEKIYDDYRSSKK